MISFGIEATDGSGWAGNALRFATEMEASIYGRDLMMRWLACQDTRVREYSEPVSHAVMVTGDSFEIVEVTHA